MNGSDQPDERHPVELLSEEFSERLRRGETPSIDDYVQQYPEHSALIRSIFPSLMLVERVSAAARESSAGGSDRLSNAGHVGTNVGADRTNGAIGSDLNTGELPKSFGDFEVIRRIGSGGMGVVYEAIQRSLQRHVALKVMNAIASEKPQNKIRFRREAESAAGLHHTNIVPIFGIGEDHGLQYYAMQLIEGISLHEVIESVARMINQSPQTQSATSNLRRGNVGDKQEGVGSARPLVGDSVSTSGSEAPGIHGIGVWKQSRIRFCPQDAAGYLMQDTASNTRRLELVHSPSRDASATLADRIDDTAHVEVGEVTDRIEVAIQSAEEHDALTDKLRAAELLPAHYYRNVARLIANVANALDYAHHCGVLHRDIKPANLLLDHEGTVWVTDFGLAKRSDTEGATETGEVLGTLRYMAPEQLRGGGDSRIDIYSLGLTLYELLTLQGAIESPRARLLDPERHSVIAFPRALTKRIPRDLQTIVLKACSYDPNSRYQRARELESDLQRFLEDRPIAARRANPLELMVRWGRRNPAIAALTVATFGLLISLAGVLGVWNRQQQSSLKRIEAEKNRAEMSLVQLQEALTRVSAEQQRAESNMELALEAFDRITTNIASRGSLISANFGVDDEDVGVFEDATLTQADVELLQLLQDFFGRFAEENATDLRIESAISRRRVGEIQHRIGKLEDATQTLEKSLKEFAALRRGDTVSTDVLLEEIAARHELISVLMKRGQFPRALNFYQETRKFIDRFPDARDSLEGRFAMAKLLNSMSSGGARLAETRRRRVLPGFGSVRGPQSNGGVEPIQPVLLARLNREKELNDEAAAILDGLIQERPENSAFRATLSRVHKNHIHIAIGLNDIATADLSFQKAVDLLEKLLAQYPESTAFKYELADTLGIMIAYRPVDEERCSRGLDICNSILEEHPAVPDYQALKASLLSRLARFGWPMSERNEKAVGRLQEAVTIQRSLVERYPSVPIYSVSLVQTLFQISEVYLSMKRPEKARQAIAEASQTLDRLRQLGATQAGFNAILDRLGERGKTLENRADGSP